MIPPPDGAPPTDGPLPPPTDAPAVPDGEAPDAEPTDTMMTTTACAPGTRRECYGGPAGTQGVGRCAAGSERCTAEGAWAGACEGEVRPALSDTCGNGIDDNCNGTVDEACCPSRELGSMLGVPAATGSLTGAPGATAGTCGGMGGEATLRWTAPTTARYEATTGGSDFDTVLYVRAGSCAGRELACNDDVASGVLSSSLTFDAVAGQTYVIVVDAYGAGAGRWALNLRAVPMTACTPGATRVCYAGPAATIGVGRCRAGSQTCDASGNWPAACAGEVLPAASETCGNTVDDNCNGAADEGCGVCTAGMMRGCYSGPPASQGVGRCRGGAQTCDASGNWPAGCEGEVVPDTAERCGNGSDDDCDGTVDEGCGVCTPGVVRGCYGGPAGTQGVGLCRAGTQTCDASGNWPAACAGEVRPMPAETCGNGVDDNCNGTAEEGCGVCTAGATRACYTGPAGTQGAGRCRAGSQTCDASGNWPAACAGEVLPAASETCGNGLDDDCDGSVDEMCPVLASSMESGWYHTCVVRSDTGVSCWGDNSSGKLGDGTTNDAATPVRVVGLTGVSQVALGTHHTCALVTGGAVYCWGSNLYGQLGDGTTTQRTTPVRVTGIAGATAVAAGSSHSCAVMGDRTVRCWGLNTDGQLGDGTTTQSATPVAVAGLSNVVEVAVNGTSSDSFSCARLADRTVRCWGSNDSGRLGDGTSVDRTTPVTAMGVTTAASLALGTRTTCAVLTDNTVRCWGSNGLGTYGDGTNTSRVVPTAVAGLTGVAQLRIGSGHTCGVMTDGSVRCWGANSHGQLGDGTVVLSRPAPGALVPALAGAAGVSAGYYFSCARLTDGSVRCWGDNYYGQVGDGVPLSYTAPQTVAGLSGVVALSSGGNSTCARLTDGTARCWGSNSSGQLGSGSSADRSGTPVTVSGLAGFSHLSVGDGHACARLTTGALRCWGGNSFGQLGTGSTTASRTPVAVPAITTASDIALGESHSCARLTDNTVRCWGYNLYGQLGDGTTAHRNAPTLVGAVSTAAVSASGGYASFARLADGSVRAWGHGTSGQLGNGATADASTPVTVSALASPAQLSGGSAHTCARLSDGTVRCWGANALYGQVGDGTSSTRTTPVAVTGLAGVAEIDAGDSFTVARLSDGTARAWGNNFHGQLGDGTRTVRRAPVTVAGLAGVTSVAAGYGHACASLTDGTVRCWGWNYYGQLGNGQTGLRTTAVRVGL